jgi:hypothetical protein
MTMDTTDWNAIGVLEAFADGADGKRQLGQIASGPLHHLVRTAAADEDEGEYVIFIGGKSFGGGQIRALYERDDFPTEEDPTE